MVFEQLRVIGAGVLHAAIGVMHQPALRRSPPAKRHVQGLKRQGGFQGTVQRPADHAPRERIQDDRQVDKLQSQPDVSDIGHPKLIERGCVRRATKLG